MSESRCPRCGSLLLVHDDPEQEGWGNTFEWTCPHCGYWSLNDPDEDPEDDEDLCEESENL